MGAPNLIVPGIASGTPVGGSGTAGTLPIWTASSTLGDSAIVQASGAIATISLTTAGTSYLAGTYANVPLTGGTGTGATADINVLSGVLLIALRAPGNGYIVGDILSASASDLGGTGSGFQATVASVIPDIEITANITTSGRLGSGTTNPRAGLDVQAEAAMFGGNSIVAYDNYLPTTTAGSGTISVSGTAVTGVGTKFLTQLQVGSSITCTTTSGSELRYVQSITNDLNLVVTSAYTGTASGVTYTLIYPKTANLAYAKIAIDTPVFVVPSNIATHVITGSAYFDAINITNSSFRYIYGGLIVKNLAAGWSGAQQYIGGGLARQEPTDLATSGSWFGSSLSMRVENTCGSNTTAAMTSYSGSVTNNKSGHTITAGTVFSSSGTVIAGSTATTFTNFLGTLVNNGTIGTSYGLRLQAPTGTGTYTTRYGISQEDTAAINVLSAATSVGTATAPTTNTLDVSTAGWGVKLNATPGNGNANTLDCYAEGSYTATAAGFTVTGSSPTQPLVVVQYTRIGRLVTLTGKVTLNAGTTNWTSTIGGATITLPTGTTFDQIDGQLGAGLLWSTTGTPVVYSGVIMHATNRFIYFPTVTPATTLTHYFTLQYMTAT